jgi:hypothetical protein
MFSYLNLKNIKFNSTLRTVIIPRRKKAMSESDLDDATQNQTSVYRESSNPRTFVQIGFQHGLFHLCMKLSSKSFKRPLDNCSEGSSLRMKPVVEPKQAA